MVTHKATLGETLFPKETIDSKYFGVTPIFFTRAWETQDIFEIEDLVFLLKRSWRDSNPGYVPFCIEKVFAGLADPHLAERVQERFPFRTPSAEKKGLIKEARESIGKLALEVFFDTILDQNKKAFWEYLGSPENWKVLTHNFSIYPTSLCVFLNYLATCNEDTKRSQKGSIRKFLKSVCGEPLEIDDRKIGISSLSKEARENLAFALVANGMYEECLDYNITEAYNLLVSRLLGGIRETEDGLMENGGRYIAEAKAFQRACDEKEYGHILGVLIRMALKNGYAKVARAFDAETSLDAIRNPGGNPRLAILWQQTYGLWHITHISKK